MGTGEDIARAIEASIGKTAFEKLGAVSFYFVPAGRSHFRDLKRGFVEVSYAAGSNQFVVQYDSLGNYVVQKNRVKISGPEAEKAHTQAVSFHINDFYWFNPFVQMRSPGAILGRTESGELLVHYESGGVTPGDTYAVKVDANGRPVEWRLWVSVLPLKGIGFSFDDWSEIAPGVFVSTMHKSSFKSVEIRDVKAFPSYPGQENKDRFAELAEMKK
ncbi:MAG TPA: hypothetical protein PKE49_07555 [Leptospiraceae bacterium]|nr:hypothetical protein [Leptospirales bacterium]HMU82114.1 hypothetical protein [Leptospiraceae bacterium]HMX56364.1 hypothetical protein [Leptospiraceae bacterium]HMY45103.1 hypothetical protein [Leptospiraceae bacterium]HMZ36489.1 hypothetical protein [Leptospiraceae bacterium]